MLGRMLGRNLPMIILVLPRYWEDGQRQRQRQKEFGVWSWRWSWNWKGEMVY